MTATAADVARMTRIIRRMRARGLTVIETADWQHRGRPSAFDPRAVFEHHDASTVKSGRFGSLPIIISGRDEIPGPLSQFQVARDGAWVIVAAGRANHAGEGGPTIGIPKDSGNRYAYGAEVANDGVHEPYSDQLQHSLNIGFACILEELG
jgi:hypothetical protein